MSPGNMVQMVFFAVFGVGSAIVGLKVFSDATDPVRIQEKRQIYERDTRHRTKRSTPEALAKYYDKDGVRTFSHLSGFKTYQWSVFVQKFDMLKFATDPDNEANRQKVMSAGRRPSGGF
jgi:hypothetical protein